MLSNFNRISPKDPIVLDQKPKFRYNEYLIEKIKTEVWIRSG